MKEECQTFVLRKTVGFFNGVAKRIAGGGEQTEAVVEKSRVQQMPFDM